MREIGVVGGGASAVCLLDALARERGEPGALTVFEPGHDLWRGRPFQQDTDSVRVNAPPAEMSVRSGDPGHFEQWLAARDILVGGDDYHDERCGTRFVPRGVYGEYLEQSARAALLCLLERGWRITVVRDAVTAAVPAGAGLALHTGRGQVVHADRVVLCVGVGRPADLYSLAGSPGFVAEPYPLARTLPELDPHASVAVVGSGLTGVDAVLGLAARGHRGPVRLLSRRGVLPGVRQRPVDHRLRHFAPERFRAAARAGETLTLPQLVELMRAELSAAGEDLASLREEIAALELEDPVARLKRQLAEVASPGLALRILQRAVPDTGPDVWPRLSEEDKQWLLREHYRTIMSLCCPMPPASAAALLAEVDAGRLEILAGLEWIERRRSGFAVTVAGRVHRVDVVLNAVSPPASKIPPRARELVGSLVAHGLAERHPRGGVRVERATSRATVAGVPEPRVHVLGDLAAGSLFFTFGIPSLADRASDIAGVLTGASTALQTV
ncbi:FAD/NAD(P)-binding protein [Amycolatopsis sacchari]|uniref:FAD/NAD(P)-binding protein n=1 Tax=Amycolatopsis sacchari TaxID=115433 RepID=UPI003D724FBB